MLLLDRIKGGRGEALLLALRPLSPRPLPLREWERAFWFRALGASGDSDVKSVTLWSPAELPLVDEEERLAAIRSLRREGMEMAARRRRRRLRGRVLLLLF